MRFQVHTGKPESLKTGCLVLPVFRQGKIAPVTRVADKAGSGAVSRAVKRGDMRGETGQTLLISETGLPCQRILLVGCGDRDSWNRKKYRKAVNAALNAIKRTGTRDAAFCLGLEEIQGADPYRQARILAELSFASAYHFDQLKEKKAKKSPLRSLSLVTHDRKSGRKAREGMAHGEAIGNGMDFSRDLGNLPGNKCTPSYLASRARSLAGESRKATTKVLTETQMKRLGMGALLSVTAGSAQPAKFIIIEYKGARASKKPVVLVGKGITFDTGGISLKPPGAMDEMKFDMCGAAAVLGVAKAAIAMELPINLVVLVPTCENMPGSRATKPGDIVRSMSGQTIEVINTDAEGRLILCDALSYGLRYKPAAMIDVATLTGACVIALGKHTTGLLSNNDDLADRLLTSGQEADDAAWRLPLGDEYMAQLKSPFADVSNVGGREAGTITAACFLSRFVKETPWAHLDIAGTAWKSGASKGATARPVPLLVEYLLRIAG